MGKTSYWNYGEKITLIKPMGSLDVIGQQYEIGGITDDHIIIRDAQHRIAIAACDYKDFDTYFIKSIEQKSWTAWSAIIDENNNIVGSYRSNGKKVQVKTGKVRAEASCCPHDTFNLALGVQIAFLRCQIKAHRQPYKEARSELDKLIKLVYGDSTAE